MLSGRYLEAEPLFERAIRCADSTLTWAQVTVKLGELAFKEDRKDRAIELWESALVSLGGKLPSRWQLPFFTIREIVVQTVHTFFSKGVRWSDQHAARSGRPTHLEDLQSSRIRLLVRSQQTGSPLLTSAGNESGRTVPANGRAGTGLCRTCTGNEPDSNESTRHFVCS